MRKTIILLCLSAISCWAQAPACSTITDSSIYNFDSNIPANGTITVTAGYSQYPGGSTVPANSILLNVVNGVVKNATTGADACLVPSSYTYTAVYSLVRPAPQTGKAASTRFWLVTSTTPLKVSQIETGNPSVSPGAPALPVIAGSYCLTVAAGPVYSYALCNTTPAFFDSFPGMFDSAPDPLFDSAVN